MENYIEELKHLYLCIVNELAGDFQSPANIIYETSILDLIHENCTLTSSNCKGFYYDGQLYKCPGSRLKIHEVPELDESLIGVLNNILNARKEAEQYSNILKVELYSKDEELAQYYANHIISHGSDKPNYCLGIKSYLDCVIKYPLPKITFLSTSLHEILFMNQSYDSKSPLKLSNKAQEALDYLVGLQLLV